MMRLTDNTLLNVTEQSEQGEFCVRKMAFLTVLVPAFSFPDRRVLQ